MKSLLRSRTVQSALPVLLGRYLPFALGSGRWTLEGAENFLPYRSAVFSFWHEHLLLMPALAMLARRLPDFHVPPIHALVSRHRDGRFIGELVRQFGIEPVLGSTSRGGARGLSQLARLLRSGAAIAITPDGPRGPRRCPAPGVAQLAALAGVPLFPCAARSTRRIVLNTWDRMQVPLPFARGVVVCGPPIEITRASWREALPAITQAMNRVSDQADARCAAAR
jgi:lysophospholipid acyltransferase (LPLAT)-like uncharacterized protein